MLTNSRLCNISTSEVTLLDLFNFVCVGVIGRKETGWRGKHQRKEITQPQLEFEVERH